MIPLNDPQYKSLVHAIAKIRDKAMSAKADGSDEVIWAALNNIEYLAVHAIEEDTKVIFNSMKQEQAA